MHLKALIALLLVRIPAPASVKVAESSGHCRRYQLVIVNESIQINTSLSSRVLNESGVASDLECLIRCRQSSCAVAVFNKTSRGCQLFNINNEQSPDGNHVTRLLSLPQDGSSTLWKLENLELQLRTQVPSALVFKNSGTGRLGVVQSVSINATGCYRIEAFGAAGGNVFPNIDALSRPGRGALAAGCFSLVAGTRLEIVVGHAGGDSTCLFGAGGGGGSFVYVTNGTSSELLLAAGGGGGSSSIFNGMDGSNEKNGSDTSSLTPDSTGRGGFGGQPGLVSSNRYPDNSCGGPGAGWNGSAVPCNYSNFGGAGLSRIDGWLGGARKSSCLTGDGGYGGGGAGGGCCDGLRLGASGGGGGFSGGGASSISAAGGGGGGSYCSGIGCVIIAGGNSELQGRVLLASTGAACV